MAGTQYSLTDACVCGKPLKVFPSSGRTKKACSPACYPYRQRKRPSGPKPRKAACVDCGAHVSRYSKRCEACYRVDQLKASPNRFTCEQCGKEAHRSPGGTNRKKGLGNRWCSMQCRVDAACVVREQAAERRKRDKAIKAIVTVLRAMLKRERAALDVKPHNLPATCKECGCVFDRPVGTNGTPRKYCSDKCASRKVKRTRRKTYGNKYRHRARKAGVV